VSCQVLFDPAAERAFLALPKDARQRIAPRLRALADAPRPPTAKGLVGSPKGLRKLRVGPYRVVYFVDDEAGTVTVYGVGHRGHVYQRAKRPEA